MALVKEQYSVASWSSPRGIVAFEFRFGESGGEGIQPVTEHANSASDSIRISMPVGLDLET